MAVPLSNYVHHSSEIKIRVEYGANGEFHNLKLKVFLEV